MMRKTMTILFSLIALMLLLGACSQKQAVKPAAVVPPIESPQSATPASIDSGISGVESEEKDLTDKDLEDIDSTLSDFEKI